MSLKLFIVLLDEVSNHALRLLLFHLHILSRLFFALRPLFLLCFFCKLTYYGNIDAHGNINASSNLEMVDTSPPFVI